MVTSTVEARRASLVWALDSVLEPALQRGLAVGTITCSRSWSSQAELVNKLKLLFGHGVEFMQAGVPPTLENLAVVLKMKNANTVFRMLRAVNDWNWLIDNVRLSASDRGQLSVAGNAMVIRSDPHSRTGASIFGVASRSIPEAVMKRLAKNGVAPGYNAPSNTIATDCSVWLVEVGEGWSLVLRIEPLVERTWFDPASYDEQQRPHAEAALSAIHGEYETSDMVVVRTSLIDSYLTSVKEIIGDASGLTYESGCLQRGEMGKRTAFVGGQLGQIMAVQAHGAHPFFDLARLQPHDPRARGGGPTDPWSGLVAIGEESCSFLLDREDKPRGSLEMAWGAKAALLSKGPDRVRGIFRPVNDKVVRDAGGDPTGTRYVVGQAKVGKHGAQLSERVQVGFLVREHRGEVSSGWSVPLEDIYDPTVQRRTIARAEAHCKRMDSKGEFRTALSHLRDAGVQQNKVRVLPQIRARNGLAMVADILSTRTALNI